MHQIVVETEHKNLRVTKRVVQAHRIGPAGYARLVEDHNDVPSEFRDITEELPVVPAPTSRVVFLHTTWRRFRSRPNRRLLRTAHPLSAVFPATAQSITDYHFRTHSRPVGYKRVLRLWLAILLTRQELSG